MRLPARYIASILAALVFNECASFPLFAASVNASVNASTLKPLVITKLQDLDLGSVTLGPGIWSNATVSLSRAGIFTCGTVNVTCTGASLVAKYNVQGSNQQSVNISAPNVTLVNQSDATKTLTLVVDAPASVVLPNSGQPGIDISLGGSVTINSNTAAGTYRGTFNVTVDY